MVNDSSTRRKDVLKLRSEGLTLQQALIAVKFSDILQALRLDIKDGLENTPARYAKFLTSFLERPEFSFTLFEEKTNEMVIVNKIPVVSLCEHHTLPFFGTASVAYIPNGFKIVGLSKLPRLVSYFAAGFQNQERITNAVGEFITEHGQLKAHGVGVVIRCEHTCMTVRGVKAHGSTTRTQFLSGVLKNDAAARAEFFSAVEL